VRSRLGVYHSDGSIGVTCAVKRRSEHG
jgi:hypothetical protein